MTELFLYDREKGLFKEILKNSKIIKGRYHVSPNYGKDLDTNNLETYIKDPASGLSDVKDKYPICVCMTPRSKEMIVNGNPVEQFVFNLYFITTTYYGNNQIKNIDRSTNTSTHHVWYDWQDMKTCASNFIMVLKQVIKTRMISPLGEPAPRPLRQLLSLEGEIIYNRLTKFNNDRLSGVSVSFVIYKDNSNCYLEDYEGLNVQNIVMPSSDIHRLHT